MSLSKREEVKSYRAMWDLDDHRGAVVLVVASGTVHLKLSDPNEFRTVVDLLRNEKPIFYDFNRKFIQTGDEPIGEGEK